MRTTSILIAAALLALTGLANAAMPAEPEPTRDEPRTHEFILPAGHMVQGRVVDGTFTFEVVPATDELPDATLNTAMEGFAECINDVPGYEYWDSYRLEWVVVPTVAQMTVALAPATNYASADACWTLAQFTGPLAYLSFQTAGVYGGAVELTGADVFGYGGLVRIECDPAGFGVGTSLGAVWLTTFAVDDAECKTKEWGSSPGTWVTWSGEVLNYNTLPGQYVWAWAY